MSSTTGAAGEQATLPITHRVLAAAEDTERRFTILSLTLPPHHPGTPLHAHAAHAEGCYVLEGTLAVTQGEHTVLLTRGGAATIPAGVAHSIWNPTAGLTTVLLIYSPGVKATAVAELAAGVPEEATPHEDTS